MSEKNGNLSDEEREREQKLAELDEKVTPEVLIRNHKINLYKKIGAGEINLTSELRELIKLEEDYAKKKAAEAAAEDDEDDEDGLNRIRIKRPYTMSPDALRARRENARKSTGPKTEEGKQASAKNACNWKHGAYSKSMVKKILGLCTENCGKYPCQAVADGDTYKGEICLNNEGVLLKIKTLVEAAETGDIKGVNEINAVLLSMAQEIVERMGMSVLDLGTLVKEYMYDKWGNEIGFRLKNHPNLAAIIDFMSKIGITLRDSRMTPLELQKSREVEDAGNMLANLMSSGSEALKRALALREKKDDGDGD